MSVSPSTGSKMESKQQYILDKSFELVLRKGFSGLGLQEILKHADIPKGSFYHYFPSKEAFFCVLLQDYMKNYQERLVNIWSSDANGKTKILDYFRRWISDENLPNGWAESCLIIKLAAEVTDLSESMRLILQEGVISIIKEITQLIEQGIEDNSIVTQGDSEAVAQTIYQIWVGAALMSKISKDKRPLHQALETTENLLNHSIKGHLS